MRKLHISFDNYNRAIQKVNIKKLPQILQKGHRFFLEASEYYAQEIEIKETIDVYLEMLNTHLITDNKTAKPTTLVSVSFIDEFIKMHQKVLYKKELNSFIQKLHRAIESKKITRNDLYATHITEIQQKIIQQYNSMIDGKQLQIIINQKWLKNLKDITSNAVDKELGNIDAKVIQPSKSLSKPLNSESKLFTSFDKQPTTSNAPTFKLKGAMGELLGDLEKFELAITIEGDQGGGKTRFTYQLADAFAEIGNKVAIFTLEIGGKSDLITRMRNQYLQPKNRHLISRADQLPDGYKTIENAAKQFDVIVIDSWNKTGLPSQDFDRLRKENPNTIFIVIFQRTTGKTIRGGTAPLFDAGINIEVVKVDDTFINNYAVTTKNRYGVTGIKYNISTNIIINEESSSIIKS